MFICFWENSLLAMLASNWQHTYTVTASLMYIHTQNLYFSHICSWFLFVFARYWYSSRSATHSQFRPEALFRFSLSADGSHYLGYSQILKQIYYFSGRDWYYFVCPWCFFSDQLKVVKIDLVLVRQTKDVDFQFCGL